ISILTIFIKSKKMKNYLIALSIIAIAFAACKKKKNCEADAGGNLTLVAYAEHHGKVIPNMEADSLHPNGYPDTVYVKFNAQDSPGSSPSNYDTFFVGELGEDHIHIHGLKCGDYYLYAVGFDAGIGERVFGGTKFSTDKTDGEIVVHIPVTEGH